MLLASAKAPKAVLNEVVLLLSLLPISGVKAARCVALQRLVTGGGIAVRVTILERLKANRGVIHPARVVHEGALPEGRVFVTVANLWALRMRKLRKAAEKRWREGR